MRKIFSLCFLAGFLLCIAASPLFSQTAEVILSKMIEAQGGSKALKSLKDMTLSGTIELATQGLSGSLTSYKKEPNKRRTDIEIMGTVITQAYDGKMAWGVNPQTGVTLELSGEQAAELKRNAMPIVSILNPEKYGLSFAYKGKEKINDKNYFILEETYPDGFTVTIYIDTETYLIHKSKGKTIAAAMGEVEFEQVRSDYKKVNGMTLAHSTVTFINGEEAIKIAFTEVSFNTGLEDSFFKMPE